MLLLFYFKFLSLIRSGNDILVMSGMLGNNYAYTLWFTKNQVDCWKSELVGINSVKYFHKMMVNVAYSKKQI